MTSRDLGILDFASLFQCVSQSPWTSRDTSGAKLFIALCGYPLVKMELEIQTRFLPRLPFSCNSIISDKIWRKMSLSLSVFFSFASNFPCKILWDNKNIDANILIFQIPFSQCCWPRRKKLFWGFFLSIKKSACVPNLKFLRHPQQVFCQ